LNAIQSAAVSLILHIRHLNVRVLIADIA